MKLFMGCCLGIMLGACGQAWHDHKAIEQARQNEIQANGLEDQCKAKLKELEAITQTGMFIGICSSGEYLSSDNHGRFECVKP